MDDEESMNRPDTGVPRMGSLWGEASILMALLCECEAHSEDWDCICLKPFEYILLTFTINPK